MDLGGGATTPGVATSPSGAVSAVTGMFADFVSNVFKQPEGVDAVAVDTQATVAARLATKLAVLQETPALIQAIVSAWALKSWQVYTCLPARVVECISSLLRRLDQLQAILQPKRHHRA